jgi:hypothetical protein
MTRQLMDRADRQPSPRRSTASPTDRAIPGEQPWPRLGRAWRTRLIGVALAALVVAGCEQADRGSAASSPATRAGTVLPAGDATATQRANPPVDATRPNPRPDCPRLDSMFRQVLEAPDPAAFAARRVPGYKDGRVEVSIRLSDAEGDLAQRYGLQVSARTPMLIEAYAPLPQLCDLSNDPRVKRVGPTRHTGY